jgi:branched-chain amino acid aminotransferase
MQRTDLNSLFDKAIVNVNGNLTTPQNAQISVFDRGFLYGDSIYEVTFSDSRSVVFLEEHLDRLENSAALIGLPLFYSRAEIKTEILKTLKQSNLDRTYIRIIVTRGDGNITLDPLECKNNNLVIIVRPLEPYPQNWYQEGVSLCFVSIIRNDRKSVDPNAKSGNYLNNVLAIKEAKERGYFDALMINKDGLVTEGTTFNIWIVKNNTFITPHLNSGLLKGITRTKLLEICREKNLKFEESELTPSDFLDADEVFLTSSTKGMVPVNKVDSKEFDVNSFKNFQMLKGLYQELIDSIKSNEDYRY